MRGARLIFPAVGLVALVVLATQLVFRAEAIPFTVDLNSSSADLEVLGDNAGDLLKSVATGDINGDTIGDLIVGAALADSPASDAGATYVIYGSTNLPASIDLDTTAADLTVTGAEFERSGTSVAAGDINGDTVDDLVIGAPFAGGQIYVIYGSASLPATIDLSSANADLVVLGDDGADRTGAAVAVGDVNGDTVGDLIIGAPGADPGGPASGAVYVVFGSATLPATIDLGVSSADVTVLGDDTSDALGAAVATGDVNGDTVRDLILGAPNGRLGKAYVIYGGALPAVIDLDSVAADFTMIADGGFDDLGRSVASADVSGDTIADVIVGAASPATHIVFGGPTLPAVLDLDVAVADVTVLSAGTDHVGWAVAAADVDGDTIADAIIGAPHVDTSTGGANAGEVYVIYGSASLPAVIDPALAGADVTVKGENAGDQLGLRVAAGDITGDTVAELIGSAPEHAPGGRARAGAVYVFEGGQRPPPTGTPTPCSTPCPTTTGTPTRTPTPTRTLTPTPTPCPTEGCPTATPQAKTEMHLEIDGSFVGPVHCDSRTQTTCKLLKGTTFSLHIVPSTIPVGGYTIFQAWLEYGSLVYKPTTDLLEENKWDQIFIAYRDPQEITGKEGVVIFAAISGFFPPFPVSFQKTPIVNLTFNCAENGQTPGQAHSSLIRLVDQIEVPIVGTAYTEADGSTISIPNVSGFTVECTVPPPKLPDPGDTDQDGCTDQAENGPNENFGGQRNYLSFWDFFDVWTHPLGQPTAWERDKVINVPGDIIGVVSRFGPGTAQSEDDALAAALTPPVSDIGYHAAFDRGPVIGANNWDRAPADGAINIPDDIIGVALQFGHNCGGA